MTFAPFVLVELQAYWKAQGGVALGIVGNKSHTVGYHLGRDRIYDAGGPGLGANDYSVQTKRDRAGLSNAASAIDLGRLDGTYAGLRKFSRWLVAECQADRLGHRDIREVIYSPDGTKVQRYSGVDGLIHTGDGNGDASHRSHTHISFFRDSLGRDKVSLFAPYFPDSTGADPVKAFPVPEVRTLAQIKDGATLYDNSALAASGGNVVVSPAREMVLVGTYGAARVIAYEPPEEDEGGNSRAMYARLEDVGEIRPDPTFTEAQVNTAYNAGLTAAEAAVAAIPKR